MGAHVMSRSQLNLTRSLGPRGAKTANGGVRAGAGIDGSGFLRGVSAQFRLAQLFGLRLSSGFRQLRQNDRWLGARPVPWRAAFKAVLATALLYTCAMQASPGSEPGLPPSSGDIKPWPATHLHNVFRVSTNLFSGNAPDGAPAFSELAELGIKTIISVDGSRPEVEAARKHGLRYIHLPIGYDGVQSNRVVELVVAARKAEGPVYVHCHHGLHRGPAAVAVICQATAGWTTNQAVAWMRRAGTSTDYPGLYRGAVEFRPPDAAALARVVDLPETASTSSLVQNMVAIDTEFERLKAAQKTGWKHVPNHPDLAPAHTATILWELLRELPRLADTAQRPADYRGRLAEAELAADRLRKQLRDGNSGPTERDETFKAMGQTCAACHQAYRNAK